MWPATGKIAENHALATKTENDRKKMQKSQLHNFKLDAQTRSRHADHEQPERKLEWNALGKMGA